MFRVYLHEFKNYANFKGRASVEYYRSFILMHGMIFLCLMGLCALFHEKTLIQLLFIYLLSGLLPMLAVMTRRFHDLGKSGWNIIGINTLTLASLIRESSSEPNKYGEKPNDIAFIKEKTSL
ncbi:Inner membrane protein yhaI [Phocoenobacter uteri]|uniref:Inner membrane protein yhaI n=2 Tax=Phocoenobacter uteri TaxID=146806 RepID=A0A379CAX0_9PAST|nr:Inner membrane protein yhaI [Phocoenobacter uteri]